MKIVKFIVLFIVCQVLVFNQLFVFAGEQNSLYKITFEQIEQKKDTREIPKTLFKKFITYKVNLTNHSEKEFKLSYNDLQLVYNNKSISVLPEEEIYKKAKTRPILRSIIIGIPITILSAGFFTVPTVATTFALSVDKNNTLKKKLDEIYFDSKIISPNETLTCYVFTPKHEPPIKQITIK